MVRGPCRRPQQGGTTPPPGRSCGTQGGGVNTATREWWLAAVASSASPTAAFPLRPRFARSTREEKQTMKLVVHRFRSGSASAAALLLVALIGTFVLLRGGAHSAAAVPPATCVSVSCETFVVFDSQNGGLQMPPPCVNHGCPAGCSGGSSTEGGGWQTCKCGGQVEPRCCHLLYRDNGEGGYEVSSAGFCESEDHPSCPEGDGCTFEIAGQSEPLYYERYALCGV